MLKLRGTQEAFVSKAVAILSSKSTRKCILVAPVAYGKSICIANTVLRLDAPTIVIQPNQELLKQNYAKYVSYGYKASICCVSLKERQRKSIAYTTIDGKEVECDKISNITYATIGSLKKHVALVRKIGVKYIIMDECHVNSGTTSVFRNFIRETGIKNIIGVTATALVLRSTMEGAVLRMMDRAWDNMFSTLSYVVQIQEVVKDKYWCPLVYMDRVANTRSLKYNTGGSDYTRESLSYMYEENNSEARAYQATKYMKEQGRKSILIFVPSIENAINLAKKIPGSAVVHSKMPKEDRTKVVDDFKNLKISVVINVQILTTGFDHPLLDGIILVRPTASIALYYQMVGRITRIHPDKLNGLIIDLSGNVSKFGRIEDLNYEYIDGYGWGLYTKDTLLTNYPLRAKIRPTKETIRQKSSTQGLAEVKEHSKVKIWFGKHKGKPLEAIPKGYLAYMIDEFDFHGAKMVHFKKSLETYLKIM